MGWCRIDLGRPDIHELLGKIEDFCRRESWGVRAWYSREFTGESDWFALKAEDFKDNATADRIDVPGADGEKIRLWPIKAYADLSPDRSAARTAEFHANLAAEELLETKPAGTVIAICPDGDNCLLTPAGAVERWSHEAPEVCEAWPTLAQFVADALQS